MSEVVPEAHAPEAAPAAETAQPEAPAASPFEGVLEPEVPEEQFVAEAMAEAGAETSAEETEAAEATEEAPAEAPKADSTETTAEEVEAEASEGDAPATDADSEKAEGETKAEEAPRVPPWRREQAARKARQEERAESAFQMQLQQQQQLFQAQLAAETAKREALEARLNAPRDDGPAIKPTGDALKDLEAVAKAHGLSVTDYYQRITERMANEGAPGGTEALELAKRLADENKSELQKLKEQLDQEKQAVAQERQQMAYENSIRQGEQYVAELITQNSETLDWHQFVPQPVLQRTIAEKTRFAIANKAAIEQQTGQRLDDWYVARLVDDELTTIYANIIENADSLAPSRVKGTRREAPGKPEPKRPRKSGMVTSKDAAATSSSRPMTQEERDRAASRLFDQAVNGT